jgi:DNA-binding winged helix-turn-helix (wHTH) protein
MITMRWPQYLRRECTVHLSRQQTEALSTLLMRYPDAVSHGDLIEAIWPDPDLEPDAESKVHTAITRLRAKIGNRILCDRRGYRLIQCPNDLRNVA